MENLLTLGFAQEELDKYWKSVTGEERPDIALRVRPELATRSGRRLDPELDDAYGFDVKRGGGEIYGLNPRSLLMGVYRFFYRLGCRFLYPTPRGERLVRRKAEDCAAKEEVFPPIRHRGITIEGCVSKENVVNMIDWAPKAGFNSYFIQFRDGYEFYERWYRHLRNPFREPEAFDDGIAAAINAEIVGEIKKRGLVHHAVGHGWTCEPLGIRSRGWRQIEEKDVDGCRQYLAEIDGKRGLFRGVPLNTNLCYSNPEARRLMVDGIVEYLRQNPAVGMLHVWLADNYNNFCACENCRKLLPSEHYVTLLNELDEALTRAGLSARIVFLIYFELLVPPRTLRIANPSRFVMMFAPISRTYLKTFAEDLGGALPQLPAFELNRFVPPQGVPENLAYLKAWQEVFSGDSFVFEYHMMWDVCREYAGIRLAKTIYEDIAALPKLGLNGFVSCQLQRVFFPTGFCMYVMGRSLADGETTFEGLAEEYFSAAFGKRGRRVYAMLERLSYADIYPYLNGNLPRENPEVFVEAEKLREEIAEFIRELADWETTPELEKLADFLTYMAKFLQLVREKCRPQPDPAVLQALFEELRSWAFSAEPKYQEVLDSMYYTLHAEALMNGEW